jgi:hypothetical protein
LFKKITFSLLLSNKYLQIFVVVVVVSVYSIYVKFHSTRMCPLVSHVVLHPTPLPTTITQIYALVIAVHGLATLFVVVAEGLLFSLGRGHFGGMLFAPFGATILEPDLKGEGKQNYLSCRKNGWCCKCPRLAQRDTRSIKSGCLRAFHYSIYKHKNDFIDPPRWTVWGAINPAQPSTQTHADKEIE